MLLMLFVVGVASTTGAIGKDSNNPESVAKENLGLEASFKDVAVGAFGYTEAFLGVIFAYGGFNQTNYVIWISLLQSVIWLMSIKCSARLMIHDESSSLPVC